MATTTQPGMMSCVSYMDMIQFVSLAYAAFDLMIDWDEFKYCSRPIHFPLMASYVFGACFRTCHLLGNAQAGNGKEFLLSMRHEQFVAKVLMWLTWCCFLPMFVACTSLGTYWLHDVLTNTAYCLPPASQPWFIISWQVMSYVWIIVYVLFGAFSCIFERRLRAAERLIRQVEDPDSIARWGHMSDHVDHDTIAKGDNAGMKPEEIAKLPTWTWIGADMGESECAICLGDLADGDQVRGLGCDHVFHKSCIDMWVVRNANCPLCKRSVVTTKVPEPVKEPELRRRAVRDLNTTTIFTHDV